MCPEISLFGVVIRSYDLMAVLGALACIILVWKPLRRVGLTCGRAAALLIGMCAAFLVGARLWNVAVNAKAYGKSLHWYSTEMTGFSLYGGLVGAFLVLLITGFISRRRMKRRALPQADGMKSAETGEMPEIRGGLDIWQLLDAFVIPAGTAFCFARVGCFLTGCCGGKPTDSIFGISYGSKSSGLFSFLVDDRPVHPTQLYELFGALVGLVITVQVERLLKKKLSKRGKTVCGIRFLFYGGWFSLMRLFVLPFRDLKYASVVVNWIYPSIYLVSALVLFWGFYYRCKADRQSDEVSDWDELPAPKKK